MKRSTILTIIGAIGVVGTAIMASKAAPKVTYLLEAAEEEKGEELTVIEKVKVVTPTYIPTMVMGAATIGCIFGANVLNMRDQAALTSAYALLDNSYKEYQRKTNELYGEDADRKVKEAVVRDRYQEIKNDLLAGDKLLFWDYTSCRYFEAKIEDVLQKVELEDGLECYILSSPFDSPENYYIY